MRLPFAVVVAGVVPTAADELAPPSAGDPTAPATAAGGDGTCSTDRGEMTEKKAYLRVWIMDVLQVSYRLT